MLLPEEEGARGLAIVLKIRIQVQVLDADKNWGNTDTTDHLSHRLDRKTVFASVSVKYVTETLVLTDNKDKHKSAG